MRHRALDNVLTKTQRDSGLYLEEPDDHVVVLKHGDEVVATFYQTRVTAQTIRETADRWLKEHQDSAP